MAIYNNTSNVNGIYVGSQRCIKAYIGSTLCWEAPKSYGDLTISVFYPDIPNAGGTVTPLPYVEQTWGYYSDTSGGGINCNWSSINYTFSSTLPTGWTFNSSTGAITATSGRMSSKTYTISVTASANGKTASCTTTVTQEGAAIIIVPGVSVIPSSLSFGYAANSSSATVTCPSGSTWTASSNASWITVSPTFGISGDTAILVNVSANSDSSSRSGFISFSSTSSDSSGGVGSITRLSVSQEAQGSGSVIASSSSVTLNSTHLTRTVTISLSDGSSLSSSNSIDYLATANDWMTVNISYSGGNAIATISTTKTPSVGETYSATIIWRKTNYSSATTTVTYS